MGNCPVGEAHDLCLAEDLHILYVFLQGLLEVDDLLQRFEEERRDHCQFAKRLDAFAAAEQFRDCEDAVGAEFLQICMNVFIRHLVKLCHVEVADTGFKRTDRLQEAFLQCGADAHDFAGCLHLGAEHIRCQRELVEREARELCDKVIERRFDCGGSACDRNILECHADRDLCGDAGNRITACLGSQRRGTRYTRIDFDQIVFAGVRIQRELHVAAAGDLKLADDLDRAVIQHLQIMIIERKDRCDDDTVTGMHADRVDVLHAADRDRMVIGVTHDFKFDFLVSLDGLLNENLMNRGKLEGIVSDFNEFLLVVRKAAAGAAERERRTEDYRVADIERSFLCLFDGVGDFRRNDRLADRLAHFLEELTVFRTFNTVAAGADQFDTALFQNALLLQLHREIQTGLSADARQDRIRTLIAQDLCDIFQCQRLHVYLVRDRCIGHDRRRVGVAENDLIAFLLQRKTRLGAGIVEFRCLTDDDRSGADDENLLKVCTFCHITYPPRIR